MNSVVIDASVAIAILRDEPEGPPAAAAMDRWVRDRVDLVVPSHFWLEVLNGLIGRYRWPGEAVLAAIHALDAFDLQTVDLDRALLVATLDVAERHGLTAYDATYLALADATDGGLLTFDRPLSTAAGAKAIALDGLRLSEAPAPSGHDVTWPNYKGASAFLARLRADARDVVAG